MRVLLVADFYPPHIGGVELQVQALARALSAGGAAVCVATVRQPGLVHEERDGDIRIVRLPGLFTAVPWFSGSRGRRYVPPLPDPRLAIGLRRLVRRFRPDVVQVHGWSAYSVALALVGSRVPLVVSVRDYGYSCATRNMLVNGQICDGPTWEHCMRQAARTYGPAKGIVSVVGVLGLRPWLARRTRIAHAVSRGVAAITLRDFLRSDPSDVSRVVVLPDIVPQAPITADVPGPLPVGLPEGPFILFVGALQAHKGLAALLSAYHALDGAPPLVMIGTRWPDTPALPEDVIVLEDRPHAEVMVAWDRCLFGVVPSIWADPLPGVVREGMSRGKPIIGSAVGGIVDMIEDGQTGLLVAPGDVEALAGAMRRLLDDPLLRERLGSQARVDVARYDAATVGAQFRDLYERLAAEATGER